MLATANRSYIGKRFLDDQSFGGACVVFVDGTPLEAPCEWGYQGEGPKALAHALLRYECGEDIANERYLDFAYEVISKLPRMRGGQEWLLTSADIWAWLDGKQPADIPAPFYRRWHTTLWIGQDGHQPVHFEGDTRDEVIDAVRMWLENNQVTCFSHASLDDRRQRRVLYCFEETPIFPLTVVPSKADQAGWQHVTSGIGIVVTPQQPGWYAFESDLAPRLLDNRWAAIQECISKLLIEAPRKGAVLRQGTPVPRR